jgi:hypothetical protein
VLFQFKLPKLAGLNKKKVQEYEESPDFTSKLQQYCVDSPVTPVTARRNLRFRPPAIQLVAGGETGAGFRLFGCSFLRKADFCP